MAEFNWRDYIPNSWFTNSSAPGKYSGFMKAHNSIGESASMGAGESPKYNGLFDYGAMEKDLGMTPGFLSNMTDQQRFDYFNSNPATLDKLNNVGTESSTGKFLGGGATDWANVGLGVMSYLQGNKMLDQQKRALDQQIKESNMNMNLGIDDLYQKSATRASLAQGFGGSASPYLQNLGNYSQFYTGDNQALKGLAVAQQQANLEKPLAYAPTKNDQYYKQVTNENRQPEKSMLATNTTEKKPQYNF